jgi:steroid delta-isomerase-like uncharacterized protein
MTSALLLCLAACGGEQKPAEGPESNAAKVEPTPAVTATVAATTEATPPPAPKPTFADLQGKAWTIAMEGMNTHDAKKAASIYSDGASWQMIGMPPVTGREAIEKNMAGYYAAFPDMKSGVNYVFNKGDVSIVVSTDMGTHKGDMGPWKATSKPVGWTTATVQWWTDDGKIKQERMYWDANTFAAQIGASKQKGQPVPTAVPAKPEFFNSNGGEAEAKNVAFTKPFYAAWENKKGADFLAVFTDNSEWTDNTSEKPHKGSKDAKAYWDMMAKAFPDAKMAINNQWAVGDFVITETTMTGTHKGALMGQKATNKQVSVNSLDILQWKDGKIVKGWSFSNSAQMAEQLGWMKAPGADKPAAAPAAKAAAKAPAKK